MQVCRRCISGVGVLERVKAAVAGRESEPLAALALTLAARVDVCDNDLALVGMSRELRLVLAELHAGDKLESGIDQLIESLGRPAGG